MPDGDLIALDLGSRRRGVAEGRPTFGTKPRLYHFEFYRESDESPEPSWGRALVWIVDRLKTAKPCRVVIEAPIMPTGDRENTNAKTVVMQIGLYASIVSVLEARNIQWRKVAVSTVRKHFIGRGNLPGDVGKREVRKRCEQLGWEPANLDQSDAAAVWDWGVAQMNPTQRRLVGL